MVLTMEMIEKLRPIKPRSLKQPFRGFEEPGTNWNFELWQALLDVHETIFQIGRLVLLLDKSGWVGFHTTPLPINETLEIQERDLARLSTSKTEVNTLDIVHNFLLESLFLDPFWKPIKEGVCLIDFETPDLSLVEPLAALVVLNIRLIHIILLAKARHIALLVKEVNTPGPTSTQPMQEGVETLRKLVACVDEMSQHLPTGEKLKALTKDKSPLHLAHLGNSINSECLRIHSILARFDVSSVPHYISYSTMTLLSGLMHIVTIVMMVYLRWPFWCSFIISIMCHALIKYGHYTTVNPLMKFNEKTHFSKDTSLQMYTLHALTYTYLHLSVKEVAYLLLWTGALCGLIYLLQNQSQERKVVQSWGTYRAMAIYFVICGIHLRHGWLALAIGSWLIGFCHRALILTVASRFDLISAFSVVDVPILFLFFYIVGNVSFVQTACLFLYHLFIPFIMEVVIKRIMNIFGRDTTIDLTGSAMKGVANVLMRFWGFSTMQAFAMTMVMSAMSFINEIAPRYGMR